MMIAHHQTIDAFDEVGHVTERARLRACAEDGDRLVRKCLTDERRNNATIVEPHARAVGVEDANDPRRDVMFAMIRHREGFGETLGFIVATARADGADVAPVILSLRMHERIAVDFGCGRDEEASFLKFCEAKCLVSAERADLHRLDGDLEVIKRAGGRSEMPDVIHRAFEKDELGHVLLDEPEIFVPAEMVDVIHAAGDKIVQPDDLVPL